ncbi:MAG: single-stranded DNA-binding protein [Epsilonproteobacteria bacterium]|nr:single-stranded DNA-binding protein [Campylobacterota bacterium]
MNKTILIGRVSNEITLRYTQSGIAVANFNLAVNRRFAKEGEQQADFIQCVVWNKVAENIAKYLSKGSQVAVEGRIQTSSYEDKDGTKRYKTEVVAENVEFLNTKKKEETNEAMEAAEDTFQAEFTDMDSEIPF